MRAPSALRASTSAHAAASTDVPAPPLGDQSASSTAALPSLDDVVSGKRAAVTGGVEIDA